MRPNTSLMDSCQMQKIPQPRSLTRIDFFLQIFWCSLLFYILTGAAFLLDWEVHLYLSAHPDIHLTIRTIALFLFIATAWMRWKLDPERFFSLEPFQFLKNILKIPARISVTALFLIYFLTQFLTLSLKHLGLGTALWDLGYYDQVLWNTAHAHPLITSVRGGVNTLGDHFKPILLIFVPIYWISSNTHVLFVVFTFLAAASIPLIYGIAHTATRSHKTAIAFAAAVFFYQPLRNAVIFPLHPEILADPLLLGAFYFAFKDRLKFSIPLFLLALLCKESVALEALGMGLFLFFIKKYKAGVWLMGLSALTLVMVVGILHPLFRWADNPLNFWGFYEHFLIWDWDHWKKLLYPNPFVFLFLISAPFLFLPFAAPAWLWLLGPALSLRLLSGLGGLRLITAHYTAGLNALIAIAAVFGFAHWTAKRNKKNLLAAALIVSSLGFAGIPQLFTIERLLWDASFVKNQKIAKMLEIIPARYSVISTETFLAHLTHREFLFGYGTILPKAPLTPVAQSVDLVVIDKSRAQEHEMRALQDYLHKGYRLVYEWEPLIIYARPEFSDENLFHQFKQIESHPEKPYRKQVRFWYKGLIVLGALLLLMIFFVRYWRLK